MFSFLRRWLKTKSGQRAYIACWILCSTVSMLSTVLEDSSLLFALQIILAAIVLIPVFGFLTVILPHYGFRAFREWMRRSRTALRFLCPSCLHFWDYHFACKSCGHKISSLQIKTGGIWDNECSQCGQQLFNYSLKSEPQIQAVCDNCQQACELHHHQRRVRVLATLCADDFDELCQAAGVSPKRARHVDAGLNWQLTLLALNDQEQSPQHGMRLAGAYGGDWPDHDRDFSSLRSSDNERVWRRGMQFAVLDDGECLTYILLCNDEWKPGKFVALQHALRHVEAIWVNAENISPLEIGQALDRLIRHSDLEEAQRRKISVCVPQSELDQVIRNRLEALLGKINCDIEPVEFLGLKNIAQPALAESSDVPETVVAERVSARREQEFQER